MDAADKVLGDASGSGSEEEEEEEKEHFFTDMAPASAPAPAAPSAAPAAAANSAPVEQERRAQVGASPYLAPFTPLGSPSRPKTPTSVSAAQRSGRGKPQLVPVAKGGANAAFGASKVAKDDVVAHLPSELVEALMTTVQTLDKLIAGVEDYKADQLGLLYDRVQQYVELLKKVDASSAGYDAMIPLQVLE